MAGRPVVVSSKLPWDRMKILDHSLAFRSIGGPLAAVPSEVA